jgi:hypothetical protein
MSYDESLRSISLNADSTVAVYTGVPGLPGSAVPNYGFQYRFVKITAAHQVGLVTTKASDVAVGVLQNKPQVVGQAATVGFAGVTNVMAGAAIPAGSPVTADANGRAIVGTVGTDKVYGVALAAAGVAGELLPVLLQTGI